MASSSILRLTSILLVCMMVCAPLAQAAITCGQVQSNVVPCLSYIRTNGAGPVPPGCCRGIASLNSAAKTTPDRQAACDCLKKAAGAVSGVNAATVAALPSKCKVNIPYKLSLNTNCKSIK